MVLHSTERQSSSGGSSGGSHGGNGGGGSSIALLQERFRQLQKMREKRREMELLKLFPEPETMSQSSRTNHYEPLVRPLAHPDTMNTRAGFQDSTSLGLDLYTKQAETKDPAKTTQVKDFWQVDSKKHEVDTSLRL